MKINKMTFPEYSPVIVAAIIAMGSIFTVWWQYDQKRKSEKAALIQRNIDKEERLLAEKKAEEQRLRAEQANDTLVDLQKRLLAITSSSNDTLREVANLALELTKANEKLLISQQENLLWQIGDGSIPRLDVDRGNPTQMMMMWFVNDGKYHIPAIRFHIIQRISKSPIGTPYHEIIFDAGGEVKEEWAMFPKGSRPIWKSKMEDDINFASFLIMLWTNGGKYRYRVLFSRIDKRIVSAGPTEEVQGFWFD